MTLHEFVPFPLTAADRPGHVCNGGCYCHLCTGRKSDRAAHYQRGDRRRAKAPTPRSDGDVSPGSGGPVVARLRSSEAPEPMTGGSADAAVALTPPEDRRGAVPQHAVDL
jgi:hypothetical protein